MIGAIMGEILKSLSKTIGRDIFSLSILSADFVFPLAISITSIRPLFVDR